jgi:ElaB/YqjD/DUF883 family membrane-anchored ribosome-binding protein
LTGSVIVDQGDALDLIDQLRVTIPEEIRSAKRVNAEVERLLEQAREEAEQILARAQEQATYLIEERELTRQAEEMSDEIVRQAQEIRRGADDYAAEVLVALEAEVARTLKTIRHGLNLLDERRSSADEIAGQDGEDGQDEPDDEDDQGELDEYDQPSDEEEPVRG